MKWTFRNGNYVQLKYFFVKNLNSPSLQTRILVKNELYFLAKNFWQFSSVVSFRQSGRRWNWSNVGKYRLIKGNTTFDNIPDFHPLFLGWWSLKKAPPESLNFEKGTSWGNKLCGANHTWYLSGTQLFCQPSNYSLFLSKSAKSALLNHVDRGRSSEIKVCHQ